MANPTEDEWAEMAAEIGFDAIVRVGDEDRQTSDKKRLLVSLAAWDRIGWAIVGAWWEVNTWLAHRWVWYAKARRVHSRVCFRCKVLFDDAPPSEFLCPSCLEEVSVL